MIDAPYVLLTIFKLSVVISCFLLNNAHHDFIICRQTYFIISKWVFFVFFCFLHFLKVKVVYFHILLYFATFVSGWASQRNETDKAMRFVCVFLCSPFNFLNMLTNFRQIQQGGRDLRDVQLLQVS